MIKKDKFTLLYENIQSEFGFNKTDTSDNDTTFYVVRTSCKRPEDSIHYKTFKRIIFSSNNYDEAKKNASVYDDILTIDQLYELGLDPNKSTEIEWVRPNVKPKQNSCSYCGKILPDDQDSVCDRCAERLMQEYGRPAIGGPKWTGD